MINSHLAPA